MPWPPGCWAKVGWKTRVVGGGVVVGRTRILGLDVVVASSSCLIEPCGLLRGALPLRLSKAPWGHVTEDMRCRHSYLRGLPSRRWHFGPNWCWHLHPCRRWRCRPGGLGPAPAPPLVPVPSLLQRLHLISDRLVLGGRPVARWPRCPRRCRRLRAHPGPSNRREVLKPLGLAESKAGQE